MSGGALYVYGVLPADAPPAAFAPGAGVGGGAVTALACGDLAALVSPADGAPVSRSRRNLLAHTSVLERALPHATILPLRFGTVAPGARPLQACLGASRAAFHAALRGIEGQVELGLKAVWRQGLVFNDIVERESGLRQLRDRLRSRPPSETYYERIELGRRVEAALADLRASEAASILETLLPLSTRALELRLQEDEMVLNHAFLVRRDMEQHFDAAVQMLGARHMSRLEFRYVGPVPPFNFVTLQAGWLTEQALAGAQ